MQKLQETRSRLWRAIRNRPSDKRPSGFHDNNLAYENFGINAQMDFKVSDNKRR